MNTSTGVPILPSNYSIPWSPNTVPMESKVGVHGTSRTAPEPAICCTSCSWSSTLRQSPPSFASPQATTDPSWVVLGWPMRVNRSNPVTWRAVHHSVYRPVCKQALPEQQFANQLLFMIKNNQPSWYVLIMPYTAGPDFGFPWKDFFSFSVRANNSDRNSAFPKNVRSTLNCWSLMANHTSISPCSRCSQGAPNSVCWVHIPKNEENRVDDIPLISLYWMPNHKISQPNDSTQCISLALTAGDPTAAEALSGARQRPFSSRKSAAHSEDPGHRGCPEFKGSSSCVVWLNGWFMVGSWSVYSAGQENGKWLMTLLISSIIVCQLLILWFPSTQANHLLLFKYSESLVMMHFPHDGKSQ